MNRFLILLGFIGLLNFSFAQDTLVKMSGKEYLINLVEVSEDSVRFTYSKDTNNYVFDLGRTDVFMIKQGNGKSFVVYKEDHRIPTQTIVVHDSIFIEKEYAGPDADLIMFTKSPKKYFYHGRTIKYRSLVRMMKETNHQEFVLEADRIMQTRRKMLFAYLSSISAAPVFMLTSFSYLSGGNAEQMLIPVVQGAFLLNIARAYRKQTNTLCARAVRALNLYIKDYPEYGGAIAKSTY